MKERHQSERWVCNCPPPLSDIMEGKDKQCMVCGMKKTDVGRFLVKKQKERIAKLLEKPPRYTNPFKKVERVEFPFTKERKCLVCDKKFCRDKEHLYIIRHHTIFDTIDGKPNGKVVAMLSKKGIEAVNKLK